MTELPPIAAGILVGGASTRMGRRKADLMFDGDTFIHRIRAALTCATREVWLIGGDPAGADRHISDAADAVGPMAGVLAGLRKRRDAAFIIAACDMPRITDAAVRWLIARRTPSAIAVMPTVAERIEPLLAVYEPAALAAIELLARSGRFALHALATRADVDAPGVPADLIACWSNVNTPDDYRALSTDPESV